MKKRIYLLVATVMSVILSACSFGGNQSETESENEITKPEAEEGGEGAEPADLAYEKITVTYSEPQGFSFRQDLEKTQTDYASYYFMPSIGEQERSACIGATDKLLSYADEALPDIEVAVLEQEFYDGVAVSDNRLYLSPQVWDSVDYLAKVLLSGYGGWGNYGLAYGYADYLFQKAGLDSREAERFLPMSAPEAYDLNLLCFNEKFVSAEDVEAAKNNACLFVEEYLASHSEGELLELLAASGTEEGAARAREVLETFYAEKGVGCSLTEIRYQCGGMAFDYGAACEYACFYIGKDWQDGFWESNPMVSENFLHEDYGEVRKFFECNVHQMGQYQELFGLDSYNNDLTVVFTLGKSISRVSVYRGDIHTIYLLHVSSLMHEYIHSMMYGHTDLKILWKEEGLAQYFIYEYNAYLYDLVNNMWNDDTSEAWIQEYIDMIGRPIDMRIDSRQLTDIEVYDTGVTDPNLTVLASISFIGYLVDQYGKQAVIAYACSDSEYNEEWGKSYDELVQDWNRYMEENYSLYSKNEKQSL